jgi:hypothetical protein
VQDQPPSYPWYVRVADDHLEQGDIFTDCPVFIPPSDLDLSSAAANAVFRWELRDVVVMSQSCDMVKGSERIREALLCALFKRTHLAGKLAKRGELENVRKGRYPGFHILSACDLPGFEEDVRVVDFATVYTLPVPFLRRFANNSAARLRILPPYREHLSQAFARFFMRVGLPVDIPPLN